MRLTLWILGTEVLSLSTDTPEIDWILPLDWQEEPEAETEAEPDW